MEKDVPERTCGACGAGMAKDQDWCLACGTAAPGRLGVRHGLRAVATAAGVTIALLAGAGAVSYAALTDDANRAAGDTALADASPVAVPQVAIPSPAAPVETPTTPTPTTPPVPTTADPTSPSSSSQDFGDLGGGTGGTLPPVDDTAIPDTGTGDTGTGDTGTGDTGAGDPGTDDGTTDDGSGTETTPTETTPEEPAVPAPELVTLAKDSSTIYDPYNRATNAGDPKLAVDGDPDTAFSVTGPGDGKDLAFGVLVDLGKKTNIRVLKFTTDTPGGSVEVYGEDGSAIPPTILDPRWINFAQRAKVDETDKNKNEAGDGEERIGLSEDGRLVRRVLVWFKVRPTDGKPVRISEIKLYG